MKKFRSCGDFGRFLSLVAREIPEAQKRGMRDASEIMVKEAKAEIGSYQKASGPFPAWAPLSEATLEGFVHPDGFRVPGKLEHYPEDPLLRTGEMRESVRGAHDEHHAIVGSNSEVALDQEMGTPNALYPIPPRSFLGRALFVTQDADVAVIMRHVLTPLVGHADADRLTRHHGHHHP